MKNIVVLTEDGAFALLFLSHPRGFDSSRVPTLGIWMPGGQPVCVGGGGGSWGAAGHGWNWLMDNIFW